MIFKNSNFSEQAAWISIIFTIFMAVFYSNGVMQLEGSFATHPDQIVGLWAQTIIVSVVFILIAFVTVAIFKSKEEGDDDFTIIDERDELIEAKATTFAYININVCIVVMLVHVFCQGVIPNYPFFKNVPPLDFLIHGLMYSGLLVEFILRVSQLYRYRKIA
jgi:hypothetical protein